MSCLMNLFLILSIFIIPKDNLRIFGFATNKTASCLVLIGTASKPNNIAGLATVLHILLFVLAEKLHFTKHLFQPAHTSLVFSHTLWKVEKLKLEIHDGFMDSRLIYPISLVTNINPFNAVYKLVQTAI